MGIAIKHAHTCPGQDSGTLLRLLRSSDRHRPSEPPSPTHHVVHENPKAQGPPSLPRPGRTVCSRALCDARMLGPAPWGQDEHGELLPGCPRSRAVHGHERGGKEGQSEKADHQLSPRETRQEPLKTHGTTSTTVARAHRQLWSRCCQPSSSTVIPSEPGWLARPVPSSRIPCTPTQRRAPSRLQGKLPRSRRKDASAHAKS